MLSFLSQSQPNLVLSHPFSKVECFQRENRLDSSRAMILYSGILLDDLIAGLLYDEPKLQIWITHIDHEEAIAQQIAALQPKTVILSESNWFSVDKLTQILESLDLSEKVRILTISIADNTLKVNSKKQYTFTNFKKFINLLTANDLMIQ